MNEEFWLTHASMEVIRTTVNIIWKRASELKQNRGFGVWYPLHTVKIISGMEWGRDKHICRMLQSPLWNEHVRPRLTSTCRTCPLWVEEMGCNNHQFLCVLVIDLHLAPCLHPVCQAGQGGRQINLTDNAKHKTTAPLWNHAFSFQNFHLYKQFIYWLRKFIFLRLKITFKKMVIYIVDARKHNLPLLKMTSHSGYSLSRFMTRKSKDKFIDSPSLYPQAGYQHVIHYLKNYVHWCK